MRFLASASILAVFLVGSATPAAAQTATQTVNYRVDPISVMSVSGDPGELVINSATAGSNPAPATDASTTYSITTNESSKKITAQIDANMPAELTLTVELAAPTGGTATSAGPVTLTTAAVDAVNSIGTVAQSGLQITYTLTATANAQPQSGSRIATFTIVNGP